MNTQNKNTAAPLLTYKHIPADHRTDGGGSVEITAATPAAKVLVLQHFREDSPEKLAAVLTDPAPCVHTLPEGGRNNYAWFECTGCLDLEFTTPYFNEYVKRTGDTGRGILPDLSPEFLTPFYRWEGGLCHTHLVKSLWLEGGHLCFVVMIHAGDWNNREAADCADRRAPDCVRDSIADRPVVREFLEIGNGLLLRNPEYPNTQKPHRPGMCYGGQWLFSALVEHWLETKATPAQRELVAADAALMKANHNGIGNFRDIKNCGTRELRRNWTAAAVSWEDFQKL